MKTIQLILIIFALSVCISCKKAETSETNGTVAFTKSQVSLLNSANQFGFKLFQKLVANSSDTGNIFISPLSVSIALTMAYNGAEGNTASDMQEVLGFGDSTRLAINQTYKELMQIVLNIDSKVTMEVANSIWYRNTFSVKKDFLDLNTEYLDAEVYPADFESSGTVDLINNWVKNKTHDKIDKIINQIDPAEVIDLINAIYFKGIWKFQFEAQNTATGSFYLTDGSTTQVDFMAMKEKFRYMKNSKLSALELPYGSGGMSMLVLLPEAGVSAQDICQELTAQNWDTWNSGLDSTDISLTMPKFKFSYNTELKESLENLGMGVAFDSEKSDFSGISDEQLYISEVLHKTFVEVNEEGTEAAAVTAVRIFTTSIEDTPGYTTFDVNKPFVFAIKENSTNSIIFIGLVTNPVSE
jgi:serine protease inhibitor